MPLRGSELEQRLQVVFFSPVRDSSENNLKILLPQEGDAASKVIYVVYCQTWEQNLGFPWMRMQAEPNTHQLSTIAKNYHILAGLWASQNKDLFFFPHSGQMRHEFYELTTSN